jgi:hypothetical protein
MGTYLSERELEQVEGAENAFRSPIPTQVISNGAGRRLPGRNVGSRPGSSGRRAMIYPQRLEQPGFPQPQKEVRNRQKAKGGRMAALCLWLPFHLWRGLG